MGKELSKAQKNLIQAMSRGETEQEKKKRIEAEKEAEERAREQAKKSPYRQFLQVNMDNYKAEAWLMRKSPIAYQILRYICQNMDNYNALICSYKILQETFEVSHSTVARAIKLLQEHKYLHVAKSGTTNVYMVNKELYWHSYGTNYARAEFGAKIIISADEQDTEYKEEIQTQIKKYKAVEIKEESATA